MQLGVVNYEILWVIGYFVFDLRSTSTTFKKWVSVESNESSGQSILIGPSLGHTFLSLEESTLVGYLVNSAYSPSHEFAINLLYGDTGLEFGKDLKIFYKKILVCLDCLSSRGRET